jgi:hypothetical protein
VGVWGAQHITTAAIKIIATKATTSRKNKQFFFAVTHSVSYGL